MASTMTPDAANTPAGSGEAVPAGRRRFVVPIVGLLLLAGLVWAGRTILYNQAHETTDNAQVDGSIVPVLAKVGGYVKVLNAAENQPVKAGDVLAAIDDAEYAVRLAQADADLAAAAAVAGGGGAEGQADALVHGAQSQSQVVDAQIQSARLAQQKAAADLGRYRELVAKQIVSKLQLDAVQAAYDQATSSLAAVERQAGTATAQLSGAEAGSKLARARYVAAKAARDNAALQLSYTKVVAPHAGIVSRRQIEVGQLVQPGQPLLTIVADTSVWVTANFKETQLASLRLGQQVEMDVDSYPGCVASGTVESVSAATGAKFALLPPDNSTGNFTKVVQRVPVRIHVTAGCGPDRPLRPGMSVTAHVVTR